MKSKENLKSRNTKKKYILSFLFAFGCLFGFASFASAEGAYNMHGYAWSSRIGWINFSCENENECATSNFGVNVGVDSVLTGYAWSGEGGWISFNASDLTGCPSGTCNATFVDNKITGWAKIINSSDGWIKLGPIDVSGTDYGVYVNGQDVFGYGYSSVAGWVSFNCLNDDSCATSDFGVIYEDGEVIEWDGNVTGYAWSDNIGWVSFSCANDNSCDTSNYGVNITEEGLLEGYAWSDNIGWISFNASELTGCPSGTCSANLIGSKIVGWAKQLNDSETGWIKLGPIDISGTDYGLYTDAGYILNWAWSDAFGWLSFSCENEDECSTSNYAVRYGSNALVQNLNADVRYCEHDSLVTVNDGLAVVFSWDFVSDYSQRGYDFQLATNAEFNSAFSVSATTSSSSYVLNLEESSWNGEQLNWGGTYYWRVRASNIAGSSSAWQDGSFTISRTHGSPWVKINHLPQKILKERPITFDASESVVYDASTPTYQWTFEGGDPATSAEAEEIVVFNEDSDFTTTLRVTDGTGYYCEKIDSNAVNIFRPIWKDVSPF